MLHTLSQILANLILITTYHSKAYKYLQSGQPPKNPKPVVLDPKPGRTGRLQMLSAISIDSERKGGRLSNGTL